MQVHYYEESVSKYYGNIEKADLHHTSAGEFQGSYEPASSLPLKGVHFVLQRIISPFEFPINPKGINSGWEIFTSKETRSIKDFSGEPYVVLKPILVNVQILDNGTTFEASFKEGNIGWSDDSLDEAIEGLKAEILNALEDFEAHESILGPGPKRQLAVLRKHLEHIS